MGQKISVVFLELPVLDIGGALLCHSGLPLRHIHIPSGLCLCLRHLTGTVHAPYEQRLHLLVNCVNFLSYLL